MGGLRRGEVGGETVNGGRVCVEDGGGVLGGREGVEDGGVVVVIGGVKRRF